MTSGKGSVSHKAPAGSKSTVTKKPKKGKHVVASTKHQVPASMIKKTKAKRQLFLHWIYFQCDRSRRNSMGRCFASSVIGAEGTAWAGALLPV